MNDDDQLQQLTWRTTVSISGTLEKASTWSIGGVAAISGLIISNLESVGKIVGPTSLKVALLLFTFSILFGAVSKFVGMGLAVGQKAVSRMEEFVLELQGKGLVLSLTLEQFGEAISAPFLWPIRNYIKWNVARSAKDPLASDKLFVRLFCIQVYANLLHVLLVIAGFLVVAFGMS